MAFLILSVSESKINRFRSVSVRKKTSFQILVQSQFQLCYVYVTEYYDLTLRDLNFIFQPDRYFLTMWININSKNNYDSIYDIFCTVILVEALTVIERIFKEFSDDVWTKFLMCTCDNFEKVINSNAPAYIDINYWSVFRSVNYCIKIIERFQWWQNLYQAFGERNNFEKVIIPNFKQYINYMVIFKLPKDHWRIS